MSFLSAKKSGRKKFKHIGDLWGELMAIESKLDSLQRKADLNSGTVLVKDREISRMLGRVRSLLGKIGHKQKCLSRFIHPAPNQRQKCPHCGKRVVLDYKKEPLPHECSHNRS